LLTAICDELTLEVNWIASVVVHVVVVVVLVAPVAGAVAAGGFDGSVVLFWAIAPVASRAGGSNAQAQCLEIHFIVLFIRSTGN
jgi:hypothetical protein